MSVSKILLDSNAYFRLGDNLYPLLAKHFGTNLEYRLLILGGTVREYYYQARLQSKFNWVDNEKHIEDRKKNRFRLTSTQLNAIKLNMQFILSDSVDRRLCCSRFDVECLATALELSIPLVTDDGDLFELATDYDVECLSTLDLVKLMLDSGSITMEIVQDTVYMWDYMEDLPRNFRSDFITLFGVEPISYEN